MAAYAPLYLAPVDDAQDDQPCAKIAQVAVAERDELVLGGAVSPAVDGGAGVVQDVEVVTCSKVVPRPPRWTRRECPLVTRGRRR